MKIDEHEIPVGLAFSEDCGEPIVNSVCGRCGILRKVSKVLFDLNIADKALCYQCSIWLENYMKEKTPA